MKILHNPRCRKSRETLELLISNGKNPEIIEYLKEIPSAQELTSILKKLGISAEDLVRKGEKIYKEHYKGKKMTSDSWIKAMIKYPKLIERPIVINGKKAAIGRPPEKVLGIL